MRQKSSNMKMTSMEKLRCQSTLVWKIMAAALYYQDGKNFLREILQRNQLFCTKRAKCWRAPLYVDVVVCFYKQLSKKHCSAWDTWIAPKIWFRDRRKLDISVQKSWFHHINKCLHQKKKIIMTSCEFSFGL